MHGPFSFSVSRLDRRADVDGGQGGEDERLDCDDDDDLEHVEEQSEHEERRDGDPERDARENEEQADADEDQHVARDHVRVEPDAQADDAEHVRDGLEDGHHRHHRLRHAGGHEALEVLEPVVAHALDVRGGDGEDSEDERDRELRGHCIDPPCRDAVPLVAGERQRDEADEVHREDEEEERCDVREPAPYRLRGQSLLRDLRLRDLVQRLAYGLPLARQECEPAAHREDADEDRQRGTDGEVHHRLVDRHVERAEMDPDPLLELELVRRVEGCGQHGQRIFSDPKYSRSDTPRLSEYASAYSTTAETPRPLFATVTARRTTITPMPRNDIASATIPDLRRWSAPVGIRPSQRLSASPAAHRTAASAQPPIGKPPARKPGSPSTITAAPASAGTRRPGTGRGVENTPAITRSSL